MIIEVILTKGKNFLKQKQKNLMKLSNDYTWNKCLSR